MLDLKWLSEVDLNELFSEIFELFIFSFSLRLVRFRKAGKGGNDYFILFLGPVTKTTCFKS
jgi:hypothetical protein